MIELTVEDIAGHYSAAMDSVYLIQRLRGLPELFQEQIDDISRNVEHLKIMLDKNFWTTEDLQPFKLAIGE
jgi:hypothetical protein